MRVARHSAGRRSLTVARAEGRQWNGDGVAPTAAAAFAAAKPVTMSTKRACSGVRILRKKAWGNPSTSTLQRTLSTPRCEGEASPAAIGA